jgi:FKBP-type peptidyl-prolyl cis-trans isomerase SlyD
LTISKDSVVSISYILKDDDGVVIDQSGDQPLVYLHGHLNIVPGLENALEGLKVGEKTTAKVSPEEGYGEYDPKLKFPLPVEKVGDDIPPVGTLLELNNSKGQSCVARIVAADSENLTMDANHPLAGVTLNFEVEILEIRIAEPNELEHGHVHGPGCHHH